MSLRKSFFILLITAASAGALQAQTLEDAIRLYRPAEAVSARSAAMGNAFIGVADDFSTIYFNPAGLGLLRRPEFSLGLMNANGETETTFLGNTTTSDEGNFSMNNIGLSLPFPVDQGSLVFAFGYTTLVDFSNLRSYGGYNTASSFLPYVYDVPFNGGNNPNYNADYDIPWQIGLKDTLDMVPITDNVEQFNTTLIEGSLNQWSFGGSAEVARDLYIGLSVNVITGGFESTRRFTETDVERIYQGTIAGVDYDRTDFQEATITETIVQDYSGWNAKFGLLYNYIDVARFGATLQTPSSVTIDETYSRHGVSYFADAGEEYGFSNSPYLYDFETPWVFGFGASYSPIEFLRLSADLELRDYGEIEISLPVDDARFEMDFNRDARELLENTMNYRFGLEFQVPKTGLILRGGYAMVQSPYRESGFEEAPSGLDYDTQYISGGIGYIFRDRFMVSAAYTMATYDNYRFVYNDPGAPVDFVRTTETATDSRMMFNFTYLFQ